MDDSEIPFLDAHMAVRIRICQARSSTSSIWEKVFGSAEFFVQVCCGEAEGPNEFYTRPFPRKSDVAVNEQFSFVLPQQFAQRNEVAHDPILIKVSPYRNGQLFGLDSIDISHFNLQKTYERTLTFDQSQDLMELDIEIEKTAVSKPDFRHSFHLSPNETEAVTKRRKFVFEAMQSFLADDEKPLTMEEVPNISVACSGGGYRSTMQFCGAMEAMKESELFDCVAYLSALSGGTWYVLAAYAKEVFSNSNDLMDFHSVLKRTAKSSMMNVLVDFSHYLNYRQYAKTKESEGQPVTFVDFFGFTLGRSFLGSERMDIKLADLRSYAGSGEVPIPIATALHTRTKESSATFHADLEITPWEVSLPNYGLNLRTDMFGSEFYRGSMVRSCPELPLHFYMGASSSAFGMLLKYFLDGETTETDSDFVADVRKHQIGRNKTKKYRRSMKEKFIARRRKKLLTRTMPSQDEKPDGVEQRQRKRSLTNVRGSSVQKRNLGPTEKHLQARFSEDEGQRQRDWQYSSTSDYITAEEDDFEILAHTPFDDGVFTFEDKPSSVMSPSTLQNSKFPVLKDQSHQADIELSKTHAGLEIIREQISIPKAIHNAQDGSPSPPKQEACFKKILRKMGNHPLFTDREAVIDRTAKVLNCARGLSNAKYTPLNPEHTFTQQTGEKSMQISTEEDVIAFVDAAIINNVPSNCVLRPQRKTDILIVCDATEYKSDNDIDYLELFIAERLARQQGLKFPKVDPKRLKDNPRGVVHVFEEKNDPECPIVIWFTLSNREFKVLENVKQPPRRRLDDEYKVPPNEKFNVFPVYGPESRYSTLNTRYTPLQFDRLKELMKHNMSISMELIKRQICNKVLQKRQSQN